MRYRRAHLGLKILMQESANDCTIAHLPEDLLSYVRTYRVENYTAVTRCRLCQKILLFWNNQKLAQQGLSYRIHDDFYCTHCAPQLKNLQ